MAEKYSARALADWTLWKRRQPISEMMRAALLKREMSLLRMTADLARLARGPGSIGAHEYFRYQLYREQLSMEDKRAFLSDRIHWPLCDLCSDPGWRAATEDKWLSYSLMQGAGIATPETLAVHDKSSRHYGALKKLQTAGDIEAFLAQQTFPLFAKPNCQIASFGTLRIEAWEKDKAILHDGSALDAETLRTVVFGDEPYLIQRVVENHPHLHALSKHLTTVRLINFVSADKVATPFAVLKIPAAGNIADNFWRPGNRLAEIDIRTGKIVRTVEGAGPMQKVTFDDQGLQLPMWYEAMAVNAKVAQLFAPVAFSSLDIALTAAGPVVIEINSGSSFDLYQSSSGKGFLTPEVHAFFRSRGWKR